MFKRFWAWCRRLVLGKPCKWCGGGGARLLVRCEPAGQFVDVRGGLVYRAFTVRSANWLCRECQRKRDAAKA